MAGGGRITGRFGERLDPFSGEGAFHTGVDISAQYGDAVHATADGEVIEAAEQLGTAGWSSWTTASA